MTGRITDVAGSVVDVTFEGQLPKIKEALTVELNGDQNVMEVAAHAGGRKGRSELVNAPTLRYAPALAFRMRNDCSHVLSLNGFNYFHIQIKHWLFCESQAGFNQLIFNYVL